jgi:hypothetical protein
VNKQRSGVGTFWTCRAALTMSVGGGKADLGAWASEAIKLAGERAFFSVSSVANQ